MYTTQLVLALATALVGVQAVPSLPTFGSICSGFNPSLGSGGCGCGPCGNAYPSYSQPYPCLRPSYQPRNSYTPYNHYHPTLNKPAFYKSYDEQTAEYEDTETDASSENWFENENELRNDNQLATDNLAGAKSENANENANLAKGGESFGFGAMESDNRNLLANENNIEVANANRNELGVEVANFNANENSCEQESAALAEVVNEDHAEFCNTDIQENETENLNLNDNVNERLKGGRCPCTCSHRRRL